jgi:hypothetical protein
MKNDHEITVRPSANMSHNVLEADLVQGIDPEDTLVSWALRYLNFEVAGVKSPHTFDAKKRDLSRFFEWYRETNQHLKIELGIQ